MPYVNVQLIEPGVTPESKERLIAGITRVLMDVLDKDPESTFVVIDEVSTDNWGVGGTSVTQRRRQATGKARPRGEAERSLAVGQRLLAPGPAWEGERLPLWPPALGALGQPTSAPAEVEFDYGSVPGMLFEGPVAPGLARWAPLLPPLAPELSLSEGGTPLIEAPRLAGELGVERLFLKNEAANPTWSHKDRFNLLAVSAALQAGAPGVVLASSGNHGASAAAYAARAGLPCIVLLKETTPEAVQRWIRSYGAAPLIVPWGRRHAFLQHLVEDWKYHPVSNVTPDTVLGHPYGPEGYKTIAYELFLQLGRRIPAVVYVPTGFAELLFGIGKGFAELKALGLANAVPQLVACEPEARAPLHQALSSGQLQARVPERPTAAHSIGVLMSSLRGVVALERSGGWTAPVSDAALKRAQEQLGRLGLWAELSACAGVAGLALDRAAGRTPRGTAVCVVTSSGFKDTVAAAADTPRTGEDWESLVRVLRERYGISR
jgi:threonine synthase